MTIAKIQVQNFQCLQFILKTPCVPNHSYNLVIIQKLLDVVLVLSGQGDLLLPPVFSGHAWVLMNYRKEK